MKASKTNKFLAAAALVLATASASADDGDRRRGPAGVPPGHLPAPGECRVWHDGQPPGHQPPPTSCADARREAARTGGRVIYGGEDDRDGRKASRDDDWGYPDYDDYCSEREARQGRCDWRDERCVDRDRDGWCDDAANRRFPASLPDMTWGTIFDRGDRVPELGRWLTSKRLDVRFRDSDRDGVPEDIVWLDPEDQVIQRWIDDNGDGRADRVAFYRDGELERVLRR